MIPLKKNKNERSVRIFEILELFENLSDSLLLPTRVYLTEGKFLTTDKKEKTLFLFNDLILIADSHQNKFSETHRFLIEECQLVDLPQFSFEIKSLKGNNSITLIARNEQQKSKFTTSITRSS